MRFLNWWAYVAAIICGVVAWNLDASDTVIGISMVAGFGITSLTQWMDQVEKTLNEIKWLLV